MSTDEDGHWLEVNRRPAAVDDATVAAVGKVTEALEWVERARGRLYDFHQLSGHADLLLGEACDDLRAAGHGELADRIHRDIVGRNVIEGRWTFQMVEEYDATYWSAFREMETSVRAALCGGARHVHESEMKDDRRTDGARRHERRPEPGT